MAIAASTGRHVVCRIVPVLLAICAGCLGASVALGTDAWTQLGGSPARNNVAHDANLPVEWNVGEIDFRTGRWTGRGAKNIKWVAKLGSETFGSPVVADGKVFCATNNGAGYLKRFGPERDLGCLLAFDQSTGRFLWQLSVEKLGSDELDYHGVGMVSTPLVEGKRLWVVTNRAEVVCLDTDGFRDGENDGPYRQEEVVAEDEADVVWRFDMRNLGVAPHQMASCSPTALGRLLLVVTGNGISDQLGRVRNPDAPSFIALDKETGQLVWADSSPGERILHGQWSSPAAGQVGGVLQAIFPGGDGWLYSFRLRDSQSLDFLWKFDCNRKESTWEGGDRNNLLAAPVICDDRIFVVTGREPEEGEGPADLWCIQPSGTGDLSEQLVIDQNGQVVPPGRYRALDPTKAQRCVPNPRSAVVWHYRGLDRNGDGQLQFNETLHRTLAMPVVAKGLVVVADYSGLIHCLDAATGRCYWTYDAMSTIWSTPLVAGNRIYIANEDGYMLVFALSRTPQLLAENDMGAPVYSTPAAVGDTLYVATQTHLVAVSKE